VTDAPASGVRPYDPSRDATALWRAKRAFELGLGTEGGAEKAAAYADKLTEDYRERWLAWVRRCVADDPGCVLVAEPGASAEPAPADDRPTDAEPRLAGYAFLLPERLAFVWDAAVVNELWVAESERGTGLADALLEGVLAHARAQALPLDRVLLDVDAENERAQAFYERHGFEPWGDLVAREL
jgi:ribosomal protein S18 acetylase RimI-like enzyme